ncbi:CD1375 family protein [Desulfitobacterium hafniense]|nr:CD1375 family protein [Desulfitobacterium hafniense]
MIELYYNLVIVGKRTIEQVPDRYRVDVQALLNA